MPPAVDRRSPEQIREHYELERALAARLRGAGRDERRRLYGELYDELFRKLPHHPLVARKADPAETARRTAWKLRLVGRFLRPETVFAEIGPGDCSLTLAVAERVRQAYAVDISAEITRSGRPLPANFSLILSDGSSVPVPAGSVTVAFSAELMEHLHPDDALEQLAAIHRALAPGGVYVCVTPSRLSGPHDVSRHFDPVATGFHLREYTYRELVPLMRQVGFRRFAAYAGGRGIYLRIPRWLAAFVEAALTALPAGPRRALAGLLPVAAILGINLVATR